MKRTLLALLLCPLCTNAQLLEVNVSGGANIHNFGITDNDFIKDDEVTSGVGHVASISSTVRIHKNLRMGLAASSYRIGYRYEMDALHAGPPQRVSLKAVLFEMLALSRNHFKKFDLDIGAVGGVCVNRTLRVKNIEENGAVRKNIYKGTWVSYGLVGSLQFCVSKRLAIGTEIQPKFISGVPAQQNIFVLPVSIKGTIKI